MVVAMKQDSNGFCWLLIRLRNRFRDDRLRAKDKEGNTSEDKLIEVLFSQVLFVPQAREHRRSIVDSNQLLVMHYQVVSM